MLFAKANQGLQMPHMTVDTAVRDQAEQVDGFIFTGCLLQAGKQSGITIELAILDGVIDAHHILANNGAAAEGQMADLGVPHLSIRQTHRMARRIEAGMGIIGKISVEPGRIGFGIPVELFAGINANPVHDDKKDRTAWCARRGIHIVVILQNVHSILYSLIWVTSYVPAAG